MSFTQRQQAYNFWHKTGFKHGNEPNDYKKLEARVAMLEAKSENNSDSSLVQEEKSATFVRKILT